jgi:glycosyltransferase involved in cell wall biosynthesis
MPVYNAGETLAEALQSLSRQSLEDFEIIAVDDGSTDGSGEILQQWARADKRLKIIPSRHLGIVQALNRGLAECRADLVARMDADDRCLPTRLEAQVHYVKQHPQAAAVSCLVKGFPGGEVREGFRIYLEWLNSLVSNEDIRREIFIESPLAHPSILFRRSWLEAVGGYQDRGWAEDYDLLLRLYLMGAEFGKVAEVLFEWRESPGRLTRSDSRYSLENFLRAKAFYLKRGPLADRDAVFIWGAGMMGRRLSKQLERQDCPVTAFIDIDPKKIGRTRRGKPVLAPPELLPWWQRCKRPVVLAAVGARGARPLLRQQLNAFGLQEGRDWWGAA